MSESLTGVTFLAFGNGSPDVFSTFSAMSTNSGSLAVGELVGAAGFITAVVAGSMALVKPFKVARKSFIRDVGFFAVAASFSLVFLADGRLRLWECAVMIGFYAFYVVFVVTWHWWLKRRRRIRLSENEARLHQYIPDIQELHLPEIEDDEEGRPAGERIGLLRENSHDTIPTIHTPLTPAWKVTNVDDDDDERERALADLQSNMRVSRPGRQRRNTITPIRPSLIGVLEFRSVLSSLEKKGTTNQPIGLRRYSDDASPVLGAVNGSAQTESQPNLGDDYFNHDSQNGFSGRGRAVSANDAAGLRLDTDFLHASAGPETAVTSAGPASTTAKRHPGTSRILSTLNENPSPRSQSPRLLLSPSDIPESYGSDIQKSSQPQSPSLLAPPQTTFHNPQYDDDDRNDSRSPAPLSPRAVPTLQIPSSETFHAASKRTASHLTVPQYTDSPMVLTPSHSRRSSLQLPEPSLSGPSISPESTRGMRLLEDDESTDDMLRFKWWPYKYLPAPQIIVSTLFPTLYGWRKKSIIEKLLGIITAPSVFLLTITLPIVEPEGEPDLKDIDVGATTPGTSRTRSNTLVGQSLEASVTLPPQSPVEAPVHPHSASYSSRRMSEYLKINDPYEDDTAENKEWNRWLVFLQVFTAPIFVVSIVWAKLDDATVKVYIQLILGSLIFSLICLFLLLSTTTSDHAPKYRPLLCFLGFAVAIAWISTIADEVVGVLKAFGVILNISDAILGLTIFAVGNSLGDLVADITVAKLGYPVMALSACFGGPMLNILLGIGISGLYLTISRGAHKHAKHPDKPIKYKPYDIEVSTTLMISGVTLLVTLIGLLIMVPLNGWRMDRKIGLGLITLWTLSTIGNVIVEILGYGGALEL